LNAATYFILPSKSEGFPSSVVEAMAYGVIPIITEGCNFPEAFENKVAIKTAHTVSELVSTLNSLENNTSDYCITLQQKAHAFVQNNYTIPIIAQKLHKFYKNQLSAVATT